MSTFITKPDYKYAIRDERLNQILESTDEDEDAILEDAEDEAVAVIKDALIGKYDIEQIFAATGAARHRNVLRWARVLVIYFIYGRIPDDMVPESVVKNYDDVLEILKEISTGERSVDLPVLTTPDSEGNAQPKTSRRIGSKAPRSNDGGSPRFITR